MQRRDLIVSSLLAMPLAARATRQSVPLRRSWIPPDGALAELPRWMDLASVPGLAVAVVEDGAVAWTRVVGVANADTKAPVTPDSTFPAASLGKPVFGYVALQLVDEGRLDLDTPLVEYHRPTGLPAEAERITARQVLSHTTGLRNWRNRAEQTLTPEFPPGGRFQYSGEGFYWLGQVVEAITGRGVDAVMRQRLFAPVGMPRATYAWSAEQERLAVAGHGSRGTVANNFIRTLGGKLLAVAQSTGAAMTDWRSADAFQALARADSTLPALPNFALPNVAASLLCTAAEYATFLTLMMAGRRRAAWEITEERRRAMLTRQVDLKPGLAWGLGWGLEQRAPESLFWHWGDNGIFRAFTVGDPASRRAIVVFTNGDGGPKVYQRLIRAAIGADLAAFVWV
jgi:CubicO group peptidase (beta-lactamase class C family)